MTEPTAVPLGSVAHRPADRLLRLSLKLDAVVTGANGLAYLFAADLLGDFFDLPAGFLRGVGAFLLAFGIVVWTVGGRPVISLGAAGTVAIVNLTWVAGSLVTVAAGLGDPSIVARVWIVMQAAVVGLFALLQIIGIRRQT